MFPLSTLNWVRIDTTQACSGCRTEVSCFLNNMTLLALSSIAASDGQYSAYLHIFHSSVCGYAPCPLPPGRTTYVRSVSVNSELHTSFVSCLHERRYVRINPGSRRRCKSATWEDICAHGGREDNGGGRAEEGPCHG